MTSPRCQMASRNGLSLARMRNDRYFLIPSQYGGRRGRIIRWSRRDGQFHIINQLTGRAVRRAWNIISIDMLIRTYEGVEIYPEFLWDADERVPDGL